MKTKFTFAIIILCIALGFNSCRNDDDAPGPSVSVNDFVWKAMNLWYYWQADSPDLSDNRFATDSEYNQFLNSMQTDELFYNLLYDYGTTDRFSWIVDDYHDLENQFAGVNTTFGMKYGLVYLNQNSNQIFGFVQYVLPDSPASNAGIQRGDIFTRINGTDLTDSNYAELLGSNSATFGMGYLDNGQLFDLNEEHNLIRIEMQENPVYLTTVIQDGTHKIGYIVYNGFRANFNDELNTAIGELQGQGITDLVIDLRYNGGGSVLTSSYFGSMVTGEFTGDDFTRLTFNEKASDNNTNYEFTNEGKIYNDNLDETGEFTINHLNLDQVFIITAQGTASASEMLISCLKPYIDVVTIGTKTYGKTVGSITLYDSPDSYYTSTDNINASHTWAMQPIVFEYRNAENQSSPTQGIIPDEEVNEINYLEDLQPLGDVDEPLLAVAIDRITGGGRRAAIPATTLSTRLYKDSNTMIRFGTEMYLEKGFQFKP